MRRRFGEEMKTVAVERGNEVRARAGRWAALRFWSFEAADLLRSAVREWGRSFAPSSRPGPAGGAISAHRARRRPRPGTAGGIPERLRQALADLRFSSRALSKQPGYTAVVLLTVALGVGGTTAIFTLVHRVLLSPLPFPQAERLVLGYGSFPLNDSASVSPPDFLDYREQSSSFSELSAWFRPGWVYDTTGGGEPERVRGAKVSSGFFETLGVLPALGRTFLPEEELSGKARVAILSHGFWQRRHAGDPALLGSAIDLDGEAHEVVGILPAGFRLTAAEEIWTPLAMDIGDTQVRRFHFLLVIGRLEEGRSLAAAQAEVDGIARRLEALYPESNTDWHLRLVPLREALVGPVRRPLLLLMGAVVLVLLIACSNVAGMMLARSASRRGELAVRSALGASSGRLASLILAEAWGLALVGGALGLALGQIGLGLLGRLLADSLPRAHEVGMDGTVLWFALALSLGAGLLFALGPAMAAVRTAPGGYLGDRSRGGGRLAGRRLLVVAQVALSLVLLAGAGVLLRSLWNLARVDPGFEPGGVLTAAMALPDSRYPRPVDIDRFYRDYLGDLALLPGVESVGAIDQLPFEGTNDTYLYPEGEPPPEANEAFNAQFRSILGDYFGALGIPLHGGRVFDRRDIEGAPAVAVINEPLAEALFPGETAVGRRLVVDLGEPTSVEVVGVVGGILRFSLQGQPPEAIYFPAAQQPRSDLHLVLRTAADPLVLAQPLRRTLAALDPQLPLSDLRSMDALVQATTAQPRLRALLLGLFAGLAIFLSAIGLYGVLAFFVAQRRRELGVRFALGARPGALLAWVLRRGMSLVALGLALGVPASLAAARLLSGMVFGVDPVDPASFAAVAVLLALVGLGACLIPALRATRVDPVRAIRAE